MHVASNKMETKNWMVTSAASLQLSFIPWTDHLEVNNKLFYVSEVCFTAREIDTTCWKFSVQLIVPFPKEKITASSGNKSDTRQTSFTIVHHETSAITSLNCGWL
uniref:Uncharacterized protein n=1 Tax=Pyxicephalus adspersus TaxID=30357 RepID=A0AAV3AAF2_PYXAD|nr:TPA: hypothetical protein GDO54_011877 [Pyxicephalus adspersus]